MNDVKDHNFPLGRELTDLSLQVAKILSLIVSQYKTKQLTLHKVILTLTTQNVRQWCEKF